MSSPVRESKRRKSPPRAPTRATSRLTKRPKVQFQQLYPVEAVEADIPEHKETKSYVFRNIDELKNREFIAAGDYGSVYSFTNPYASAGAGIIGVGAGAGAGAAVGSGGASIPYAKLVYKVMNKRQPEMYELKVWGALSQPNRCGNPKKHHILPLLGAWVSEDERYYTMPYCEYNLEMFLSDLRKASPEIKEGELEEKQILIESVFPNLLEALSCMHNAGYIYRDLKPANILYCSEIGGWTLADFSVSVPADYHSEGDIVGSSLYIAPEVFDPEVGYSPASDIYALGKIMNPMLLYYRGKDNFKLMVDIVHSMESKDYKKRPSAEEILKILHYR